MRPPLPPRQVSWAGSHHQLLVLRLYVPLSQSGTLSGFNVGSMIMADNDRDIGPGHVGCDKSDNEWSVCCCVTGQTLISSAAAAAAASSIMSISSRRAIMSILSPEIRSHNINMSVCWLVTTQQCCHNVISCHITWPMSCPLSYHSNEAPIKVTYYPQDGTCT